MATPKKTGRMAQRRQRLEELAFAYDNQGEHEQAETYRRQSATILDELRAAGVCVRCGRRLKTVGADFGPECVRSTEAKRHG
jgi:hypothetical protein